MREVAMAVDRSSVQSRTVVYGCLDASFVDQIVRACVERYIPRVARKVLLRLPDHIRLDDLISAGYDALTHCLRQYQPT